MLTLQRSRLLAFAAATLWVPSAFAADMPPKVFAHYYTWWSGNRPEYPLMPEAGWYSHHPDAKGRPTPPNLYTRQISQAKAFGLAGFCCEWVGKQSPETRLIIDGLVAANNGLPQARRMCYLLLFDTAMWAQDYKKRTKAWSDPIVFDEQLARDFADEIAFICNDLPRQDRNFKSSYLHIDNRPAIVIYKAHGFEGRWQDAIANARNACEQAGGVYLIGEFEVSPHEALARQRTNYPIKAAAFDAITNYTLFSGHTNFSLAEYIQSGQLAAAFENGATLGQSARSRRYFPGIIAQYFKSRPVRTGESPGRRSATILTDRVFISDGSAGHIPIYKPAATETPATLRTNSRCILDALIRRTWQLKPDIVFVTSWNEPAEGTMIEPTRTANPAGYVMGADFPGLLDRYLTGDPPSPADLNVDGQLDELDKRALQSAIAAKVKNQSPATSRMDLDGNGRLDSADLVLFNQLRNQAAANTPQYDGKTSATRRRR